MSGRTLFRAPSEPQAQAARRKLDPENISIPKGIENVKPEMNVGDYACIHSRNIQGCTLCVGLSELLLGVIAPCPDCFSACILCVSLSELLLGVVAPCSGSLVHVSIPCICCGTCTILSNVLPYTSLIQYKRLKCYWIVH